MIAAIDSCMLGMMDTGMSETKKSKTRISPANRAISGMREPLGSYLINFEEHLVNLVGDQFKVS